MVTSSHDVGHERLSHPGVGLLFEDQFEGVRLRLTGAVQTHVATQSVHAVPITRLWTERTEREREEEEK